jgi:hypothetical protein
MTDLVLIKTLKPISNDQTGEVYPVDTLIRVPTDNARKVINAGYAEKMGIQDLVNWQGNRIDKLRRAIHGFDPEIKGMIQ